MSRVSKTLEKVLVGNSDKSIRFDQLCSLRTALGFDERVRGSHHIFSRSGIEDILNLQPKKGMAKPYQVKQVRELIQNFHLEGEVDHGGDQNPKAGE